MTNIMGNSNDDLLQASEVENLDNLNKMHPSREKQLRGSNDIGRKRKRDMGRGEYGLDTGSRYYFRLLIILGEGNSIRRIEMTKSKRGVDCRALRERPRHNIRVFPRMK
jgi:hypothetical protein